MGGAPGPVFPIAGIGVSARGLAAFEAFVSATPADTESGMALVPVQRLPPDHKSIVPHLVKHYTGTHSSRPTRHGLARRPAARILSIL